MLSYIVLIILLFGLVRACLCLAPLVCRNMGGRVIVAAGSDEKVQLALDRAGPGATGFSYDGCDGKEFRAKLKKAAGKGDCLTAKPIFV